MRDRFLDEAQITAQLAHPSIPPVHALGKLADERPFFTMKEVHGRTLAELIADGSLAEQRRLEIFQRVCEAVSYAHARGVVHCDIKPLNVMIGAFGEVLVMDWGVARRLIAREIDGERIDARGILQTARHEDVAVVVGEFLQVAVADMHKEPFGWMLGEDGL